MQTVSEAQNAPAVRIDGALFRKVLGNVPTSVSIVTGDDGAGPLGIVVGSFVSISLDPPLVGLFIENGSRSLPRLLNCDELCVNVLPADEAEFCSDFGRKRNTRFKCGRWQGGGGSAPRLDGALAWISGRIGRSMVIGDHHLIVIETDTLDENPACADSGPLIFFRGGFAH